MHLDENTVAILVSDVGITVRRISDGGIKIVIVREAALVFSIHIFDGLNMDEEHTSMIMSLEENLTDSAEEISHIPTHNYDIVEQVFRQLHFMISRSTVTGRLSITPDDQIIPTEVLMLVDKLMTDLSRPLFSSLIAETSAEVK